jgi:hypothetical protein
MCVFNDLFLVKVHESSISELPVLTSELPVQIHIELADPRPLVDFFVWNLTLRDGVVVVARNFIRHGRTFRFSTEVSRSGLKFPAAD